MKSFYCIIICFTILTTGLSNSCLFAQSNHQITIENALKLSSEYIINHTKETGQFVYEVDAVPKARIKDNYNVLRHCGTIYAMGMYHNKYPSDTTKKNISKTVDFARTNFLAHVENKPTFLAMWSNPQFESYLPSKQAKLGGAGLGIMALAVQYKIYNDPLLLEEMRALGRFILYMQKEDGSFYSKYIPAKGGRNNEFNSLYYPGEAILGLTELYTLDQNERWLNAAIRGITYLAELRKQSEDVPGDHWALIASEKLMKTELVSQNTETKNLIINHTIQICESMMREQVTNSSDPKVLGAFRYYGPTANAATALEGLLAALNYLPNKHSIRNEIELSIELGIGFLMNTQIIEGELGGGFPYAVGDIVGRRKEIKSFRKERDNVRIDYVQHALSALIRYYNYKYFSL